MARILVCGLNGAGKSTVGKALADRLRARFVDAEDLYFPRTDADYAYQSPRPEEEVRKLLLGILRAEENLVYSAVTGKYIEDFNAMFQYCVALTASRRVRIERIQKRSYDHFGSRALAGGDLFAREQAFLSFAMGRKETLVEEWLDTVHIPILRLDGEKPADEIVNEILVKIAR